MAELPSPLGRGAGGEGDTRERGRGRGRYEGEGPGVEELQEERGLSFPLLQKQQPNHKQR